LRLRRLRAVRRSERPRERRLGRAFRFRRCGRPRRQPVGGDPGPRDVAGGSPARLRVPDRERHQRLGAELDRRGLERQARPDQLPTDPGTYADGASTADYSLTVRVADDASTPVVPVQNIASGTQVKNTDSYPPASVIPAPAQTASLVKSASTFSSGDLTYQVV